MDNVQNARIESTMLGYEDHGILTSYLMLSFSSASQGFGGYGVADYGIEYVASVINTVGVSRWEDLPGTHVRVWHRDSHRGTITAIGHIIEDRWFRPDYLDGACLNRVGTFDEIVPALTGATQ